MSLLTRLLFRTITNHTAVSRSLPFLAKRFQSSSLHPQTRPNYHGYTGDETANFTIPTADLHRFTEGPNTDVTISRADFLQIYDDMFTIRTMEER